MHDRTTSLRGEVRAHKNSIIPPLFTEVPVLIQVIDRSYICVRSIDFASFYDFDIYVSQTTFGDLLFLLRFFLLLLLSPQTKLGDLLFLHRFLLLLLLLLFLFFSLRLYPTKFPETDDPIFTKLHRKVDLHLKRCIQVLEFSKWPPLPWKP